MMRTAFRRSPALTGIVSGFLLAVSGAHSGAWAAGVTVPLDEARIVTFDKPVSTVFVGNPVIADVTVIDSQRVFVLGKNFGTTNLVALDADGHQMPSERITVLAPSGNTVTVHRGRAQSTLACDGQRCQQAPLPGDETTAFDAVTAQMSKREDMSLKSAQNGAQ